MAAVTRWQAVGGANRLDEWPQARYPAVVTGHQVVQLAAGGRRLVFEAGGPPWHRRHQRLNDLIVDGGQDVPRPREESHDGSEAMSDGVGCRGSQREALPRAGQSIVAPRLHPLAAQRPELIRKMLFDQWDLGLDGEHDVAQPGSGTAVRRHAGKDPGAPLLIHKAPRAVE